MPIDYNSASFLLQRERSYQNQNQYVTENLSKLTTEQRHVYDQVIRRVSGQIEGLIFLDAPGGTGKTFLLRLILAKIRSTNNVALAVASSGIAATLLEGGKTAHSMFKLPLKMESKNTIRCNISRGSPMSKVIHQCKLIVWDEATMSHKFAFEAVNACFKDIKQNTKLFGGVPILLCGDFRQTLPVIVNGQMADEINACIQSSLLWKTNILKLNLTTNMRAIHSGDENSVTFCEEILKVENGFNMNHHIEDYIITPTLANTYTSIEDLEKRVYDKLFQPNLIADWFLQLNNQNWFIVPNK
jgi:hypothetical protein